MRIQIMVDGENISATVFENQYKKLAKKHTIVKCFIFGNGRKIDRDYHDLKPLGIKICDTYIGKNSSDMFLTTSLMKATYCDVTTEAFVLISNDKDFSAVISAVSSEKNIIVMSNTITDHNHLKMFGAKLDNIKFVPLPNKQDLCTSNYVTTDYSKKHCDVTIFVKWQGEIREIPFFNGINLGVWNQILLANRIELNKGEIHKFAEDNLLKVSTNYVYFENYE